VLDFLTTKVLVDKELDSDKDSKMNIDILRGVLGNDWQ